MIESIELFRCILCKCIYFDLISECDCDPNATKFEHYTVDIDTYNPKIVERDVDDY